MSVQQKDKQKKPLGLWLGFALILFGLLAVISGIVSLTDNKTRLVAPDSIITIEVVETDDDMQRGLSGRTSIGDGEGMLFVFDETSAGNCLVMRDMQMSIDMVWLNEDKEVITIKTNATPETYPEPFCPSEPAKYGLEISDGNTGRLGITEGVKLRF